MIRVPVAAASAALAVPALAPASQAATPRSSIRSEALQTCLDPSVTPDRHDTFAGAPCSGAPTQQFVYKALAGAPAHTYEIVDETSGLCLDQYRLGVQQEACTTGASRPSNVNWTVQHTSSAPTFYQLTVTSTLATPSPRCLQVNPQGNGQPGPLFSLDECSSLTQQVFTLVAGL